MSDTNEIRAGLAYEVTIPEFRAEVPPNLLHGKSEDLVWLYQQVDIMRQQNEFTMYTQKRSRSFLIANQLELEAQSKDVQNLKQFRDRLTSIKSRVLAVVVLLVPAAIIAAWDVIKAKVLHIP